MFEKREIQEKNFKREPVALLRIWLHAMFAAILCLCAGFASANQTPSSSSGTGPVTKTYPGTTTMQVSLSGANSVIFDNSIALNGIGGVTSAQLSPAISATTDSIEIDVSPSGCSTATLRCANRGVMTLTFSQPVTNPIIHISGLGANRSSTTLFHTSLVMTSWTAAAKPTFTVTNSNGNLSISGDEIRSTTINGQPSCTTTNRAGCGSVRMNGTITSVTFQLDMLMGGSGTATNVDGWNFTVSLDEDFGDAPASYDPTAAASHIVGGYYMGAGVSVENAGVTNLNGTPVTPSPIANATASSDTNDDGATFGTLVRGLASTIDVSVTGSGGRLQGWIDWAGGGSFAPAGDQTATNAVDGGAGEPDGVANGVIRLSVTPPAGTTQVTRFARFRWSPATGVGPTGRGTVGEIEDYQVTIYPQRADLSLSKTVSNASPAPGASLSYTLTVTSEAITTSTATATGITVQDTLPAGFTFTSASGTGSYSSGTGVWTVGSLAPGASASITINGTATGSASTTVTNIAQISASSLTDPDSTPNNGLTTEDDYATISFTTAGIYNCPTGSTSTGSGYASSGSGAYLNQIFWLDWSCGGTTSFASGSIINKSWNAGDGLVITGQVTNITGAAVSSYSSGGWGGDTLDNVYGGVNPIGLGGVGGLDPAYRVTYSATLNGVSVPLRYIVADAEDTGTGESMSVTTTGSAWQTVESVGALNVSLAGTSASWSGSAGSNNGTILLETTGSTVQLDTSMANVGGEHFAYGIFLPFDFSDAPTTGTSYGAANHRTIPILRMGAGYTNETTAYNSSNASADVDDGVTIPSLFWGAASSISVQVSGGGYLSGWIDFNDDGDFADAGEKVATDIVDGGTGDSDGIVNGVIALAVTPPIGSTGTAVTIARFRYSSLTSAPSSGLHGFGEIEDYELSIVYPSLSVVKTSSVLSDGVSGSNPKAIPGATVRYCILVTNTGSATATNISATDTLPADVTYIAGSLASGTSCSGPFTLEDDDSSGTDESDPFGMNIAGTTVTGSAGSLAAGATFAMILHTTVD